jgi:cellulose biosynthesis protein BcsQ
MNLDYLFIPITSDRLVIQSSLAFATTMQEYMKQMPKAPLKGVFVFWNQIVRSEIREVYDAYNAVIRSLNLQVLKTEIPHTIRYKKEMTVSGRQVFRSTLFSANKLLLKGSNLDLLVDEICQIINI